MVRVGYVRGRIMEWRMVRSEGSVGLESESWCKLT
jgi:hypothetical protein